MQVIFSIAFICIFLSFTHFVIGKDSDIASYVDEINVLIPDGKKKPNTVMFLKDSDNWSILEKAVSKDPEGTFTVVVQIVVLLFKDPTSLFEGFEACVRVPSVIQFDKISDLFLETLEPLVKSENGKEELNKETADQFKPVDFVKLLAQTLTAYDVAYKTLAAKAQLRNPRPIEDVVPKFSLLLKEFNSTKWEEEFYEKLTKAADDKPYETGKPAKTGKPGKPDEPDKIDLFWYGVAAFVIILLIAGPAIFLVLRRKRQASNSA
jgi:hypothetical protein